MAAKSSTKKGSSKKPTKTELSKAGKKLASDGSSKKEKSEAAKTLGEG